MGLKTICDVYGIAAHELRVFVHYHPQFYHFHVHFTRLHNDLGCQALTHVKRRHMLKLTSLQGPYLEIQR